MTKIQQLLQILKKSEDGDEKISLVMAELSKLSSMKLYTQMLAMLTDEEKAQLEEAESDKEMDEMLNVFYEQHTGQTAAESIAELQEQFAEKFLEKYQQGAE